MGSVSAEICRENSEEVLLAQEYNILRLRDLLHECKYFLWKLSSETQHSNPHHYYFLSSPSSLLSSLSIQFPHICSIFKMKPEGNSLWSLCFLSLLIYLITSPFIYLDRQTGFQPAPSYWSLLVFSGRVVLVAPPNFSCLPLESHCE